MIPVLAASQIREADSYTILNEPICSADLMVRAASKCIGYISERFDFHTSFLVICGQGNNGGDGLVIARLLHENAYPVTAFVVKTKPKGSSDFEIQLRLLKKAGVKINFIEKNEDIPNFQAESVIIDAIFGTGLSRPAEGVFAGVIQKINISGRLVISVDMPSGLFSEGSNTHATIKNTVVASLTLTFQVPKQAFFLPDSGSFVGDFSLLDIGLDSQFIQNLKVNDFYITADDIKPMFPGRDKFSHKGVYGSVLLISGSRGKTGAAVLSARGCLRAGAGLVTVHAPECSLGIIQTALPEAMVSVDSSKDYISEMPVNQHYSSVGVGPGIGKSPETVKALKLLIQNSHLPLVLDADALNILAENPTWISFLPKLSILTPHLAEFERLFGKCSDAYERLEKQRSMSVKHGIVIVLKGAHTSISSPSGNVYFNSTGCPGMGKAGSGDVLTGIITALYARFKDSLSAAMAGVYLHGLAGELAADAMGEESVFAGDIADRVGEAIELLRIQ